MSVSIDFEGRVALVTGGATGLGLAIAEALGQAGARLALNDISSTRAERACAGLLAAGYVCHPVPADVRDATAVQAMVDATITQYGRLDIVVANAGVYPNTPFLDLTESEWDFTFDTNAKGVFLTCRSAARAMLELGEGGAIVTISSGAATNAIWGWSHYCASKAAVVMLTKGMALELAQHNIRVNAVLPGFIDVPEGGAPLSPAFREAQHAAIPRPRLGEPRDIANAVVLLASPLADWITGTTLVVDGGSSAGRAKLRPVDV
ncbi:MAG: hypothetical protein DCC58_01280 [Chloroflexi bacterium]|nr:MAG: hypothetical protein DCC58_01280 [Chloroflexota bacterium]